MAPVILILLYCVLSSSDHPKYPDPLKDPKNGTPPKMNPLLHWGNYRIIRGFHFLDPFGGLGSYPRRRAMRMGAACKPQIPPATKFLGDMRTKEETMKHPCEHLWELVGWLVL